MIQHTIIIETDDLKEFLNSKKSSVSSTDYEELLFSLFVAKFHSKMEKREFRVAFPISREADKQIKTSKKRLKP